MGGNICGPKTNAAGHDCVSRHRDTPVAKFTCLGLILKTGVVGAFLLSEKDTKPN